MEEQIKTKVKTMEEQIIIKENDVRQSETIGKLALALSKAQNEFNKAISESQNPFYRSKYADLSTIINATREALFLNEIALMQFVSGDQNSISVTTKLVHSSGEWLESTISGKPAKQDCQQQGAVITYLRRYAQAAILNIAQEDDDGNSQVFIDKKQVAYIKEKLNYLNNGSEQALLKAYKIQSLEQIKQCKFDEIINALNKRTKLKKESENK